MIKAVVFDCFGVLTSDGWLPFAKRYFGHDDERMQAARDLNKQVDAGLIGYDDFVRQVADMAKLEPNEAYAQIENNVSNSELFDYISKSLKPRYKIGVLSNAGQNWLHELFGAEQTALFDAAVFSFQLGVVKPDPLMYQIICQKLAVEPSEAVFVDDIERYAEGARAIGMHSIW